MKLPKLKTKFSKINNLLYISFLPQIINTAIEIELFETISEDHLTVEEISGKLNTDRNTTEALLKVLINIEFVSKQENRFFLTDLSKEYLLRNSETNQLHDIRSYIEKNDFYELKSSLKEHRPNFDHTMWSSKETTMKIEQEAKGGAIQSVVEFITALPEFGSFEKMCDFAGNIGYYSFALLEENEHLRSHIYDLPEVCRIGKELKKDDHNFHKIIYHDFDITENESFGNQYDLFFSSHFLYQFATNGYLTEFLRKINHSMKKGAVFVSNHICDKALSKESELTLSLVELRTRMLGYPTHQIPEKKLKESLAEAGFGNFTVKQPDGSYAYPTLLFAARKIREV